MNLVAKYIENAENCVELAESAKDEPSRLRYRRMAEAWLALANEQEWLEGEVPPSPGTANGRGSKRPDA